MSEIVDPYIGFLSYQQALQDGFIRPAPCDGHPELYVMQDEPEGGERRLTYAFIKDSIATAYAVYILADPMKGKPCFGLGYAVDLRYRNQGIGAEIVRASMEELRKALKPRLQEPGFYVEAMVGVDNLASQKVAAKTLSSSPDLTKDKASGLPALQYFKYVE